MDVYFLNDHWHKNVRCKWIADFCKLKYMNEDLLIILILNSCRQTERIKLIFFFTSLLLNLDVFSQPMENERIARIYITAGYGHAVICIPEYKYEKYSNNFTLFNGISFEKSLIQGISLHWELVVFLSDQLLTASNTNPFHDFGGWTITEFDEQIYLFRVPVMVKYYVKKKWFAAGGPTMEVQFNKVNSPYSQWFSGIGFAFEIGYHRQITDKFVFEITPEFYVSSLIPFEEQFTRQYLTTLGIKTRLGFENVLIGGFLY